MKFLYTAFDSLRTKIILLVLLSLLPSCILIYYESQREQAELRTTAFREAFKLAQDLSLQQVELINSARKTLFSVSQIFESIPPQRINSRKILSAFHKEHPELISIFIANPDGEIIASSMDIPKKFNITDRPIYRIVTREKKFSIGEYQMARVAGKPILSMAYPILGKTGKIKTIYITGLNLSRLDEFISKNQLPHNALLSIIDRNGTLLYRHPEAPNLIGKKVGTMNSAMAMIKRQEGTLEITDEDGIEQLYGFSTFGQPRGAVFITVAIPKKEAFAGLERALYRQIAWFGIVLLLALSAAWIIGSRLIIRPLNNLLHAAQFVAAGNFFHRIEDSGGQGEIHFLIRSFNQMAESLRLRLEEREKAENYVRASEEKFSLAFRSAPLMMAFSTLDDGRFVEVNDQFLASTGFTREEIIGRTSTELGFNSTAGREIFIRSFKQGLPVKGLEADFHAKGGKPISCLYSGDTVLIDNQQLVLSVFHDITERKQAEEALRDREAQLRQIIDSIPHMIFVKDWDGKFLMANQAVAAVYNTSVEELTGKYHTEFHTEPKELQRMLAVDRDVLVTGKAQYIPLETFLDADNNLHYLETTKMPLYNANGRIQAVLGIAVDISERRQMEERLSRAEKMEALGTLAGGVAHDLNNVLGVLMGYSEMLVEKIPQGDTLRIYVDNILKSTEKGASIVQDLLTLARRGVVISDVINLNDVVSNFLKSPVFEKVQAYHPQVTFRTELAPQLLNVKGSPVHLEKMVMNLISNAAEAITEQGQVAIRTENCYLDRPIRSYHHITEGDYVVLTVSDTGSGIHQDDLGKIFEPFYTKKAMGRSGTGLGLAIVWGTVKDHEGYIDVQSEYGKGTTFTLYFPVTQEEAARELQKISLEQYQGRGELILVVDDVKGQREMAATMLMGLKYQARTASSGEEAVEYLKTNKADLLVLDMIMTPGIDGLETYRRALEINPKQKAILVSGFSDTDRVKEAQKLGAGAYVKKPYLQEKIGSAVREELDRFA